ncbi:uncharacterized protein LOC106056782 isoform X2 [Biomphalaria glabrata]|uniref:Uncharacterized protein LOC106056782 isoform X2 n=1 Tax=Biomphalaria glabrata TaxID=6526 RepID=A0A9W3B1E5_BIOGL|nr:uncharacterized protein LOC106056782 isoform X2 [Biomphalaria glabrata]
MHRHPHIGLGVLDLANPARLALETTNEGWSSLAAVRDVCSVSERITIPDVHIVPRKTRQLNTLSMIAGCSKTHSKVRLVLKLIKLVHAGVSRFVRKQANPEHCQIPGPCCKGLIPVRSLSAWRITNGSSQPATIAAVLPVLRQKLERTKKVAADDTNLSSQSESTLIRQLTDLLLYRLSQPNNAEKILFTESCDTVASKSELACTDYSCQTGINPDPGARIKNMVTSPNLSLTTDQREIILTMGKTIPESDVIILSASSENHYDEMQAMFQNLHTVVYPNMANFTMVLFDIGLTKEQRSTTERNCKCHVVTFPVHLFKAYMKNNFCYAWKPLIVLASIVKARKYLVYQDASVRWLNDFYITFDRTNKYGHQMFRYRNSIRSTLNTYPQMFQFMDEDPCTFTPYPEFHATSMLHKNDQLVIKTVLEPWARCALEETCMCPVEPSKSIVCKRDSFIQHRCHRFDQSAITLIMGKMYGDDIYRFLAPAGDTVGKKCVKFTADKNPNYFKN